MARSGSAGFVASTAILPVWIASFRLAMSPKRWYCSISAMLRTDRNIARSRLSTGASAAAFLAATVAASRSAIAPDRTNRVQSVVTALRAELSAGCSLTTPNPPFLLDFKDQLVVTAIDVLDSDDSDRDT
jgi:hypothetical protein